MLDTMRDVIAQQFLFDASQCGTNRRYLCYDIDTIAVLLDHSSQTANLALNSAQALLTGCLDMLSHGS